MKLSLSFAKIALALTEGEQISQSLFQGGNRVLLEQFLNDAVLDFIPIGKQQKKIICPDTTNLLQYLRNKFEIPSLPGYIAFMEKEDSQRSDAVKAASNSKLKSVKVFTGFLVNTFDEIQCILNKTPLTIKPVPGAFTFLSDYRNFEIPPDVTIVGVEGHENFREIRRQRYLFDSIQPLFVWRYQNSISIVEWLKGIPNRYIHFGDYDPKGIHIYLSEFKSKLAPERCSFFIPKDLELLISTYGEKDLFERQQSYLKLIEAEKGSPALSSVIALLRKYRKGLAQEILIR